MKMQRTDIAEIFLEIFASVPLTLENVFRSPVYIDKVEKEVVDLLLILRNKGIFISMKCQMDPDSRSGEKLSRWVQKNANAALKQMRGGIKTSKTREFRCSHPRRGQVYFKHKQIDPIQALIIIETLEEVRLSESMPLEIDSVPVAYISLNDFSNILHELRTINDLILYLDARCLICHDLQRTIGIERDIFEFYVLYEGIPRKADSLYEIRKEIRERQPELDSLIRKRKASNQQAVIIEQLSERLSTRLVNYDEGLAEEIVGLYDLASSRSSYLQMQDELCDLILDERRQLGNCLSNTIEMISEEDTETMVYQALHLDSKPDFLYIFSTSKGMTRNELLKSCCDLIQAGLSYYKKTRGLLVNYTQDRDNYETVLVSSFKESLEHIKKGEELFSKLKMSALSISKL